MKLTCFYKGTKDYCISLSQPFYIFNVILYKPHIGHIMNQVNRREFLKNSSAVGIGALTLTTVPGRLFANVTDVSQSLPLASLQTHLLNRISFGINAMDKIKYQQLGYEEYIDYQLDADNIDDSAIEEFIANHLPTVNMALTEIRSLIANDELNQSKVANELKAATFLRAVYSNKQLLQIMVEFWSNHFSVFHFDGPVAILKTKEDREVMRPLALSSFSELLHADAKSTAMIYYLDTFSSSKEAPNENYARELMELHTVGVDGPYAHFDIDEVARCFTGWGINQRNGNFRFFANRHDFEEKTVLGHTIAAGGGITDGEQVLDILAAEGSTATFIAKKLCRHFIADNPDQVIVDSTTAVFNASNGDIKQCLRHILLSEEFMFCRDTKLKRPFHFVTSAIRSLKGNILNRQSMRSTALILTGLGQLPFNWQTPDGFPDVANHWESTTGMLFRWNYINTFCYKQLPGYNYALGNLIRPPYSAENVFSQIANKVIHRKMRAIDEDSLMHYLTNGSSNNIVPLTKIQGALAIAMGSPYFQLA